MSPAPQLAERQLESDLSSLGGRLRDEALCFDLYRALAGNVWHKIDGDARVSLSWASAEKLVNDLRRRNGHDPLTLAHTGGEGEISPLAAGALRDLGWQPKPIDASRHDEEHLTRPASPPPADLGERRAPTEPTDWERRAHEEAERERRRANRP